MIEAAQAKGVKLMVGHKRRLRPQYAKMAEIVRGLRYGRPLAVQVNGFYGRELWGWWTRRETGGGLLFHSGVHDLDFLRHVCARLERSLPAVRSRLTMAPISRTPWRS